MRTPRALKYLFFDFIWDIHDLIEKLAHKHYKVANATYGFRKWLYIKVLRLKVCHFCLCDSWDYYCNECARETL